VSRRRAFLGLRVLAGAGVAALAAVLVWNLTHQDTGAARKIAHGRIVRAPAFDLDRLDRSGKLSLASLRGKVVVLNFWASDCVPCKEEMPRIEAASRRWAGKAVVVGVDVADGRSPAEAFMRRYGARYPNVFDPDAATAGAYGVYGTPMTYFVDRRGRLIPPRIKGPATAQSLAEGIRRALASAGTAAQADARTR
jgi:cytochrome c biogenesis protein CcmG/thiol:disulfide interchange protein DsbE